MAEARLGQRPATADERVARAEVLLERLEGLSGRVAELGLDAVAALTDVYGEALARVLQRLGDSPALVTTLLEDPLLRHLFALHSLSPTPVVERVTAALEEVRPYLRSHHGDVELLGVEGGVARVRLSGSCAGCGSSTATLERVVSDALLGAAPELLRVDAVPADTPTASSPIRLDELRRIPVV
jgi:Fe-S cluster biogenesis protein NfuA